jgi:3-hydroxybutyryl-CoA dehydrogenase
MRIKKILIIGCGTLGLRIALRCAVDGYEVMMYDLTEEKLENAVKIQQKILKSLVSQGLVREEWADQMYSRITTTTNKQEATKGIDLVSESVTENIELKQKVWSEFAPFFEKHTILTTNTSYLLPSSFAEASGAPERFCAWHFHDVFIANVVDIMPHSTTDPAICDTLMEFSKTIHQTPVYVKKESSGYIFNAMLMSVIGSAGHLLAKDVASIYDIDRSWMGNLKTPIGPFGMLDQVGLDTAWHITSNMKDEKSQRFAAILKTYIDEGKLGVKSGEGFYQYPHPAYAKGGFV